MSELTLEKLKEIKEDREALKHNMDAISSRYAKEKIENVLSRNGVLYELDWYKPAIASQVSALLEFKAKWGLDA